MVDVSVLNLLLYILIILLWHLPRTM